jgi:hypothetical protein
MDPMNNSLDNKEQITYGKAKDRKSNENHKRVTRQLKNYIKTER